MTINGKGIDSRKMLPDGPKKRQKDQLHSLALVQLALVRILLKKHFSDTPKL